MGLSFRILLVFMLFECSITFATTTFLDIAAGWNFTCALGTNGEVYCGGGNNEYDQCQVPKNIGSVHSIAAGDGQICSLLTGGNVICWGKNVNGQRDVPKNLGKVKALSAGGNFNCVLLENNTVDCWGENRFGQCEPPKHLQAKEVAAGRVHACALILDGSVSCWGGFRDGAPATPQAIPIPDGLKDVQTIAAGGFHTCVLSKGGKVTCWGTFKPDYAAHIVPHNLRPVQQIALGGYHTCALQIDGKVRCWGSNADGQCNVPDDLGAVKKLTAGKSHTCALLTSGKIRCWGNPKAQLTESCKVGLAQMNDLVNQHDWKRIEHLVKEGKWYLDAEFGQQRESILHLAVTHFLETGERTLLNSILEQPGVHVDKKDAGYNTALHLAASGSGERHKIAVEVLLQHGATQTTNLAGHSPLDEAVKRAHCKVNPVMGVLCLYGGTTWHEQYTFRCRSGWDKYSHCAP